MTNINLDHHLPVKPYKMPPEGKYVARMVELCDPRETFSRPNMLLQQVKLEFEDYTAFAVIYTGYPQGLKVIRSMYPDMEKKLWNIKVRHKKYEERIYYDIQIVGICDPNEVDYSKSW